MAKEQKADSDAPARFLQAGFEVTEISPNPKSIAVRKDRCVSYLRRDGNGGWVRTGPPCFTVWGVECELEDRGYQKFWRHAGKRFPVRVKDLKTLHGFDQEVRAILGIKSLFHESLGTTSARSAYDRLNGRRDEG